MIRVSSATLNALGLQQLVRVTFGVEPRRTVDPDEAVALGAAIQVLTLCLSAYLNTCLSACPQLARPVSYELRLHISRVHQAGIMDGVVTGLDVFSPLQAAFLRWLHRRNERIAKESGDMKSADGTSDSSGQTHGNSQEETTTMQ